MSAEQSVLYEFEGAEHQSIGDRIVLQTGGGEAPSPSRYVQLPLANTVLRYGDIVALAGDFYGVAGAPISRGPADEATTRFAAAFSDLDRAPANQITTLLQEIRKEADRINAAVVSGKEASTSYGTPSMVSKLAEVQHLEGIKPGYAALLEANFDHFGANAAKAYTAGHAVALDHAYRHQGDRRELLRAYAMNAFSDHYLTDLFAGGHLRVPRVEIVEHTAGMIESKTAGGCANWMHDEDCRWGLIVQNRRGDSWRAYGDKRWGDTVNRRNRDLSTAAVQCSADEVYAAWTGARLDPSRYGALDFVPALGTASDTSVNYQPLFRVSGGRVEVRTFVSDLDSRDYTAVYSYTDEYLSMYNPKPPRNYLRRPDDAPALREWVGGGPPGLTGSKVRYAYAVSNGVYESELGPWSAWMKIPETGAMPELEVPEPVGGTVRVVWRHVESTVPALLIVLDDPSWTKVNGF